MQFVYDEIPALPRLVWVAALERNADVVAVKCGPWVEKKSKWFCEGAWDGEFKNGDFALARTFAGSGGCIEDGAALFAAPTQTIDRLHMVRSGSKLWISNSLALVLAASNEMCDEKYRFYLADFSTITRGIHDYKTTVPTASGNRVHLYYFCNVEISRDLTVRRIEKPESPRFPDFPTYRSYLVESMKAVAANAGDAARKVTYRLLSTISSGYDSPACAVIAKEAGCEEAVTFTKSAPRRGEAEDDSGKEIGQILGLKTEEYEREEYLSRTDSPEIEFLASGSGGDVVMWSSLERKLEGRILVTGDHGDTLWDPRSPRVSKVIKRGDPGSSTVDFRARAGYLVLPMPFLGVTNHPDLHEVSNSAEMRPWSLDRPYNRPIPRRIVEQAGVPGNLFGQEKKVIAQAFHPLTGEHDPLDSMLTAKSFADFNSYFASIIGKNRFRYRKSVVLEWLFALNARFNWKMRGLARRVGMRFPGLILIDTRHRVRMMPHDFTFHWANQVLVQKYQAALAGAINPAGDRTRKEKTGFDA